MLVIVVPFGTGAPPTTTIVGSGPVAGLPSPSVSRFGVSFVVTVAWLLITVPFATPAFTWRLKPTTALWPGAISGIGIPAESGATPPSGWPNGAPFSVVELATYVVFAGTLSVSTIPVAGTAPVL